MNLRQTNEIKVEGCVKINGVQVKTIADISSIAGYVQQEDIFVSFSFMRIYVSYFLEHFTLRLDALLLKNI